MAYTALLPTNVKSVSLESEEPLQKEKPNTQDEDYQWILYYANQIFKTAQDTSYEKKVFIIYTTAIVP